jgi:hypothetical protein
MGICYYEGTIPLIYVSTLKIWWANYTLPQAADDQWSKTEYFTRDNGDGIRVKCNIQTISPFQQSKSCNHHYKENWINNE